MHKKLLVFAAALLLASCEVESSTAKSTLSSEPVISTQDTTTSSVTPSSSEKSSSAVSSSEDSSSETSSSAVFSSEDSSSEDISEEKHIIGIEIITPGVTSFYVGENFSARGLKVIGTYDDGSTVTIPNDRLTFSGINLSQDGTYTLTVSYQGFTDSYEVHVYRVSDAEIKTESFNEKTNTRGQDASYYQRISSISFQNEELNLSNVFIALLSYQTPDAPPIPVTVPLDDPHVTLTGFDKGAIGLQNPTLRFQMGKIKAEKTFHINVTNALPYINRSGEGRFIECRVDPAFQGMAGSIQNGTMKNPNAGRCHLFSSIKEAIDYLNYFSFDADVIKRIYLADGVYEEKLDITLPRTEIYGNPNDGSKVIITNADAVGSSRLVTKDSQAYVIAIREEANDCYFENFQIVHKAKDDPSLAPNGTATALLIQADRFVSSYNTISGLDHALVLSQDRAHFIHATVNGRKYMVDGSASGVAYFEDCDFIALDSGKEEREILFNLPNNLADASGAAKVSTRFERCNFKSQEGIRADSYAILALNSPYVSVEFKDTVDMWPYLGNAQDTLFVPSEFNLGVESIHVRSNTALNGVNLEALPDPLVDMFALANGRGHFVNNWNGQRSLPYNPDSCVYLQFDGFHHTGDGDQTVLAHDINLAASEETFPVNDLLSFSPKGGIRYDEAKHATFLGKGSSFTIKAPAGSLVYAQVILPEENRYFSTGIGVHADNGVQRINRPHYRLFCNGPVGEMKEYVFEALGDSYIKLVTIAPNGFKTSSYASGKYEHKPYPNDFFFRNFRPYLDHVSEVYYKDFVTPMRDGFCLQYEEEGYCLHVDPASDEYHRRVRVNLVRAGSYHNTSSSGNYSHYLHMVDFLKMQSEVDSDHYITGSFGQGYRNCLGVTYVRSSDTPDADERGEDYYEDSKWDCIPLHGYHFLIDIPDQPDWFEGSREEITPSAGHQSLSWASLWDSDIPNDTDLGVNFDNGWNQYAGLVNVYEGGRAYYNQELGGLTLQGNTRFRVRTGGQEDAAYQYIFKVAKGSRFKINRVGSDNHIPLDTPLPSSTPDYDLLVFAGEDGNGFNGEKTIQFDMNPLGEEPATLIAYDIVKKEA